MSIIFEHYKQLTKLMEQKKGYTINFQHTSIRGGRKVIDRAIESEPRGYTIIPCTPATGTLFITDDNPAFVPPHWLFSTGLCVLISQKM